MIDLYFQQKDKGMEIITKSLCCDASVNYDDELTCNACNEPCETWGQVQYFDIVL